MTIKYQYGVASGSFRGFTKLLFKWRGSVYKLVYKELLFFAIGYVAIRFIYKYALRDEQQRMFEQLTLYCATYIDLIPLSFVLGFYVTFVVQRWWTQFISIPFPDKLMNTIVVYIDGSDERDRILRRTLMRYINLSFVLMMMSISTAVKKRFPNLQHLVKAGYMTEKEHEIYRNIQVSINTFWFPFNWFLSLLAEARREGRIKDDSPVKHIVQELNEFRDKLKLLWCHDWVTLPLVYTQVVTWATHLFFVISLIGRQYLEPKMGYKGHEVDYYIPFFTLIQFMFYMGWLKVAEELINPFGDDDDDIECNWLIDRHLQVSYLGVDELFKHTPTSYKNMHPDDQQLDKSNPEAQLPNDHRGCTMHIKKSRKKFTFRNFFRRSKENVPTSKTIGKKNKLFCEEALALMHEGQWRFSQDQSHQVRNNSRISTLNGQAPNNHCVIQIETCNQILDNTKTPKNNNRTNLPVSTHHVLNVPKQLPQRRNTFHAHTNSTASTLKSQANINKNAFTDSMTNLSLRLPSSSKDTGTEGHTYKGFEPANKTTNLGRFSKIEDLNTCASGSYQSADPRNATTDTYFSKCIQKCPKEQQVSGTKF